MAIMAKQIEIAFLFHVHGEIFEGKRFSLSNPSEAMSPYLPNSEKLGHG